MTPTGDGSSKDRTGVAKATLLAVLLAVLLVAYDVQRTGLTPLNLVQPGEGGPSAAVFHDDFPDQELLGGLGLDGQQFYAAARTPFDLDEAAEHLDRPRYRLQRPLLSWLGGLAHPGEGGTGLIWSLFGVNVLAVGILAFSSGMISVRLGGPSWVAALAGIYPGVWMSLRVTVADALASGLALAAIALLLHERTRWAVVAAIAAVFAKETAGLILVGWALASWRDRTRWYPVFCAGAAAAVWAAFLRTQFSDAEAIAEVTLPFVGFYDAITTRWFEGEELWGLLGAVTGLAVAGAALLRRRLQHPLSIPIVIQLVFLVFANGDVLGNDFGAGRSFLPVLALGTIAFFSPGATKPPRPERLEPSVSAG